MNYDCKAPKTLQSSLTITGNRYIVRNNTHQSLPRPVADLRGGARGLGHPITLSKGPLTCNDLMYILSDKLSLHFGLLLCLQKKN